MVSDRKVIGIVGWKTGANSFGITQPYYRWLSQFGEVRILEPNGNINKDLNLIVLPGGPDMPQGWYHDSNKDLFEINVGNSDQIKTYFFENILPKYMELNVPIFGICLGHQMLAVKLADGKINPDMYHETSPEDERGKLVHNIYINEERINIKVNSLHHQSVESVNTEKAEILAFYNEKNNNTKSIEALRFLQYKAISVQWHPEEIWDVYSRKLILNLLKNG